MTRLRVVSRHVCFKEGRRMRARRGGVHVRGRERRRKNGA
jgi:hypothetical protein